MNTVFKVFLSILILPFIFPLSGCKLSEPESRKHDQQLQSMQVFKPIYNLYGVVTSVIDGDTIVVTEDGDKNFLVHLSEIDAPEAQQFYGDIAHTTLSNKLFDQFVKVEFQDFSGSEITGRVIHNQEDVSWYMLANGHAYLAVDAQEPSFVFYEGNARRQGLGFWTHANQMVEPWVFRGSQH